MNHLNMISLLQNRTTRLSVMVKQQLTPDQKRDIIHKVNVNRQKASDVAKEYNRSLATIYNVLSGSTSVHTIPRRPPISDDLRDEILRFVKKNPSILSHEIRPHLSKPVGISTINKIIRESNFICQGRQNPSRVYVPEPNTPENILPDHDDPDDICIKKEPEESVSATHQEEVSFNESLLEDDIKEEDEPQFYPDDESSGEDHVVNSILYMGKIYNPDLTIGKV